MTAKPRVRFVIAVWGERYVATLLDLALPSFLAPGNIPACVPMADVAFRIYTRPEDAPQIAGSDIYRVLQRYVTPEIIPLLTPQILQGHNRYGSMALCHHEEIAAAVSDGSIISVLSPDCIAADGSLSRGLAHILNGYKAVLVAGPRGVLDVIGPQIRPPRTSESLTLGARQLVGMGVRNLHPISQILYWDAPKLSNFPSALYWPAGKESMLMRYFHLHPLFVNLLGAPAAVTRCGSVDGALISAAGIKPSEINVVTHSDEIALLELSSLDHDPMGSYPAATKSRSWKMLTWAAKFADPTHRRQFLDHEFCFNGDEDVDWPAVSRRAKADLRYVIPGLIVLEQATRMAEVLRCVLARPRRILRAIRSTIPGFLKRLVIELAPPLVMKALKRLRSDKSQQSSTPVRINMPANKDTLTNEEFTALVARMDRGDFDFDQETRERLIALWKVDNGSVPYPTRFSGVYNAGDALAMNSRELMEVTYRLPYSLAYEDTQRKAYRELIHLGLANGVSLQGAAVVDVGCGFGGLLEEVHGIEPSARLFGLECAQSAITWMNEHRPYITAVIADLTQPSARFEQALNQPMDVVFCTAVLEHLEDPQLGLRNLLSLTPRGTVVIAVPNGRADTAAQHINFWSQESWRHFVSSSAPDRDIVFLRAENPNSPGGFENVAILRPRET